VQRGIVIIRAHGIGPEQKRQCEREGITCIDATCPNVRRIHRDVAAYASRGFHVIIVGEETHGEVRGIRGYAGSATVISSASDAEISPIPMPCIVVGQTTFKREEYRRICEVLRTREPRVEVLDTLCAATESRQESLQRLAERVDALLVIGGRKSANTRWLYQAAIETGKPSWHIEEASDIPREISGFERVGISAGASTPDSTVEEVEAALLRL
jgi:4-hydroxy-3-methylbut-2-enyl diphosphate reductase